MERKFRIRYEERCKLGSKEFEAFIIETRTKETYWDVHSVAPLVRKESASDDEGLDYVHFSLISKILDLVDDGYTLVRK